MTTPNPILTGDELAHDERWALAVRIVGSHHFGKSVHLRELLLYLAKRAIVSPSEDVTEQEIGWRVLGRRQDYNPQTDNIVRVQIRRLRQKVDEYFAVEGANEPLVISIPKGSHVLRFDPRPQPAPVQSIATPALIASEPANRRLQKIAAVVALTLVAFFCGRASSKDRSLGAVFASSPHAGNPLWSRLFINDQPTSMVIADSSIVIVQNGLQKSFTLNEYIDRSYKDQIERAQNPDIRELLKMIAGRQYTSLADATLSSELRSIGTQLGARVAVRYARHMNIRDFNSGNYILIGSSHGVPWVELFEPVLNFQFDRIGKDQRFGFRNKHPLNGESLVYSSAAVMNGPQESYATISMVPNLSHNGTVLLLNGITMEATEAAGEFAISREFPTVLTKALGSAPGEKLPYFEILLKAASMAGAPHKVEILASRRLNL
jgi:hypothetical protein